MMDDDLIESIKDAGFEIVDIHKNAPHDAIEAMCVRCHHRWVAVFPNSTMLKELDCDNCGPGYVVNTGQVFELPPLASSGCGYDE